jgi:hypothetical protein
MFEDLYPPNFWRSAKQLRKHDQWQQTFNSWVQMEGSAPSIQTMKNMMEKVKKSIKNGSRYYFALVPCIYEIACYTTSNSYSNSIVSEVDQLIASMDNPKNVHKISNDKISLYVDSIPTFLDNELEETEVRVMNRHGTIACTYFDVLPYTYLPFETYPNDISIDLSSVANASNEPIYGKAFGSSFFSPETNAIIEIEENYVNSCDQILPCLTSTEVDSLGTHLLPN